MEEAKILEKLKDIFTEVLDVESDEVLPEARFGNDLGMDSLDEIEILIKVEGEFDIEIEDDRAEKFNTVKDFINEIKRLTE